MNMGETGWPIQIITIGSHSPKGFLFDKWIEKLAYNEIGGCVSNIMAIVRFCNTAVAPGHHLVISLGCKQLGLFGMSMVSPIYHSQRKKLQISLGEIFDFFFLLSMVLGFNGL